MLTRKCASRHDGVQLFISHVAKWLRTRFSEPTFRPSGATSHRKNAVIRDISTFSHTCVFFLLRLSLFWSSFFFSSLLWLFPPVLFHLSILSEVWLLNFVRLVDISWLCSFHLLLTNPPWQTCSICFLAAVHGACCMLPSRFIAGHEPDAAASKLNPWHGMARASFHGSDAPMLLLCSQWVNLFTFAKSHWATIVASTINMGQSLLTCTLQEIHRNPILIDPAFSANTELDPYWPWDDVHLLFGAPAQTYWTWCLWSQGNLEVLSKKSKTGSIPLDMFHQFFTFLSKR